METIIPVSYTHLDVYKRQELGCTGSHFVTTNGLHDDNHYVTARDMAKISKAALENETFRYVACKPNYYIAPMNKAVSYTHLFRA